MQPIDGFLYLSSKDVKEACKHLDSVAIIREVFHLHALGQTTLPDEAYLSWTNSLQEQVRSLNMPAYVGSTFQSAGTKIINSNIANPSRGLPRASGLTLLYDNISIRISCAMESAYISSLRTASVSILATQLLQGPPIECAAVIGAGIIAQMHIELLLKYFPTLKTLLLFDLNPQRIEQVRSIFKAQLQDQAVTLQAVSSPREAILPAQLIIPATTTTDGYIQYHWLQPGAIIINVSLDDVLPEVVQQAYAVIVDDWQLVRNDPRRLIGRMYREGKIIGPEDPEPHSSQKYRRITAQLGELIIGTKTARHSTEDIILVNPFGLAIEDIALATHTYHVAQSLDIGQILPY